MRKPLTPRQREIYHFIVREIRQRGIPPTIREISDHFGMRSSNGAREALNAIARKGYIRRHDRRSRGIELVEPVEAPDELSSGRHVPLITSIPAGIPHIHRATIARYIVVDASMVPDEGSPFAVVVPDDGLQLSGFRAGDVAIAVAYKRPEDGDIVVAQLGSLLCIRRYTIPNEVPLLQTDRKDEPPLALNGDRKDVHIVGQVCALLRSITS